jgi:hypothetical protein
LLDELPSASGNGAARGITLKKLVDCVSEVDRSVSAAFFRPWSSAETEATARHFLPFFS